MKQASTLFQKSNALFSALLISCSLLFSNNVSAQQPVAVPDDIIGSDAASNALGGWRIFSQGNSAMNITALADVGITPAVGPHSIYTSRTGGAGVNRSFLGYYEEGRTLSSLSAVSWNQYTIQGIDSYLNIFITNGQTVATVVYQPATVPNAWTNHQFNSSAGSSILSVRLGTTFYPLTFSQLMEQFGSWTIYNHPLTFSLPDNASDFIGGIVLVSGSSNPTLPQTHVLDGVSISFTGEAVKAFDFVAPTVNPPSGCAAISVVSYEPGKRIDGSDILPTRQFFNNATGAPQDSDIPVAEDAINFVSLGFGGQIILELEVAIQNGEGNDIQVVETTYGATCQRSPERIKAYASQDGCNFIYLGEGCQDASFDLGIFTWAKYIKLVDVSSSSSIYTNNNNGPEDGYDLDGVVCLNGAASDFTPANLIPGVLTQVIDHTPDSQARRKNNTLIINGTPERRVPSKMLGTPENTNTVNFYSMGFGGFVVVKFDYVVFNGTGNDIRIYETSYGNPSCTNYPERANVEVSLDGITWTDFGTYCQDGQLDIASTGFQGIQYLRLIDRSPLNSNKFPGSADAYDLDGIVDLHACANGVQVRLANSQEEEVIEGLPATFSIYPNPFEENVAINFINESNDKEVLVEVYNSLGALVFAKTNAIGADAIVNQNIDLHSLSAGVYTIRVSCPSFTQTEKLIKQ